MISTPTSTIAEPARETASGQPGESNIAVQAGETSLRGLYVYGIVSGESNCSLGSIGLDQHEVYIVTDGALSALVHDCPATPYQSADRPTLEGWIVAHQRVVTEAGRQFGTILPMTFNMIVHGPAQANAAAENLRAWLVENRARFTDLLARLDGRAEFGVQILCDRDVVANALVETDPALQTLRLQIDGKPKGLGYMLRQQLAKATRAAMEAWAQQTAGEFYEQVRRCVDDVRVNKPAKGNQPQQTLLTLSCLMRMNSTALGDTLDEIAKTPGIAVRFTGPWPPYSFVSHG